MNWPIGLYSAAIWFLAAALWNTARAAPAPSSGTSLTLQLGRDVLPGILLAILIGRLA